MKKSVFVPSILGLLLLLMSGTALAAGNITATDSSWSGGSLFTTIGGVGVTVYQPAASGNPSSISSSLIPSSAQNSVSLPTSVYALTDGALIVNGDQVLTNNAIISLLNDYAELYTVTASTAGTTAIKNNTAWSGKFSTSNFEDLFTPAPEVSSTGGKKFVLNSFAFDGGLMSNYKPSQLSVYKFIPYISGVNNYGTVQTYALRTSTAKITGTTDGEAWFTTDSTGVTIQPANSVFTSGTTYYLWTLLKDGGSFDLDGVSNGIVVDPPTVTPTPDSDSQNGCVYNPSAGLSLEWLLLLAPAVGLLVARIRRK